MIQSFSNPSPSKEQFIHIDCHSDVSSETATGKLKSLWATHPRQWRPAYAKHAKVAVRMPEAPARDVIDGAAAIVQDKQSPQGLSRGGMRAITSWGC